MNNKNLLQSVLTAGAGLLFSTAEVLAQSFNDFNCGGPVPCDTISPGGPAVQVPEPGTALLFGVGLAAAVAFRVYRRRK